MRQRIHAYVLLADPAWLRSSVLSYYPYVEQIIASYDKESVGWTGTPIDVASCIDTLRQIDVEGKVTFVGGTYCDPARYPLDLDTEQRQAALDAASDGANWVLQIDSDEVIPHWACFADRLEIIETMGLSALWYPQRTLFARLGPHLFFERATRLVRTHVGQPGPLAVRPGARLVCARQDDTERFLFDIGRRGVSVPKQSCLIHYSWVRSYEQMTSKARWSGHSRDFDWDPHLVAWREAQEHPVRFQLQNIRRKFPMRLKPAIIRDAANDVFAPYPPAGRRLDLDEAAKPNSTGS